MSATAELLPPLLSYNLGGIVFRQGVEAAVAYDMARVLAEKPNFKVTGLYTRDVVAAAARAARPQGEALDDAIRESANALDPDDDSNFDRNGKPDHRALSDKLGYPVDPFERDRALGYSKSLAPAQGQLDVAEGRVDRTEAPVSRASITIKKAAASGKPASEQKAPEPVKSEPTVDPTTQGAVTV